MLGRLNTPSSSALEGDALLDAEGQSVKMTKEFLVVRAQMHARCWMYGVLAGLFLLYSAYVVLSALLLTQSVCLRVAFAANVLSLVGSLGATALGIHLLRLFAQLGRSKQTLHFVTMMSACDAMLHLANVVSLGLVIAGDLQLEDKMAFCLALVLLFFSFASASWSAVIAMHLLLLVSSPHFGCVASWCEGHLVHIAHGFVWSMTLLGTALWAVTAHDTGRYMTRPAVINIALFAYLVLVVVALVYVVYALRCAPRGFQRDGPSTAEDTLIDQSLVFTIAFLVVWLPNVVMTNVGYDLERYALLIIDSSYGLINAAVWGWVYITSWRQLEPGKKVPIRPSRDSLGAASQYVTQPPHMSGCVDA